MHVERVSEPPRAEDPHTHARCRAIAAVENGGEFSDSWPGVLDAQDEVRRVGSVALAHGAEGEADATTAAVAEGVARDLGHCGREPRLLLRVDAEQGRDLARALPREDDILLVAQLDGEDRALIGHAVERSVQRAPSPGYRSSCHRERMPSV